MASKRVTNDTRRIIRREAGLKIKSETAEVDWTCREHDFQRSIMRLGGNLADGDLHDQIARLEADIEQLAEGLERCRKAMLLSKVAIGAGGICILAYFLGIRLAPTILICALAAIIGGVVGFGSNSSTSKQITAALKAAEIRRAELIDMIDLRTVDESGGGL